MKKGVSFATLTCFSIGKCQVSSRKGDETHPGTYIVSSNHKNSDMGKLLLLSSFYKLKLGELKGFTLGHILKIGRTIIRI